jgi:CelD/BcsL family acetyltransferase involved in cellulose biosynthesis
VRISVVRPAELGPAEVAAWRSFQYGTDLLANPFLSPDFAIAVGRHRPGARVAVLADGQEITGFLPFERRRLGLGVPIAAGLTDLQGLVHAPKADWDPRELLRACGLSAWQFDHLVAGQKPFERYQHGQAASPVIDLSRGYDAYYQGLKSREPRFCSNLSRRARKLEREVGPARFVLDSHDVTGLHTLMAWKSDQYQRTGRLDRFAQPWIVALLEDLLATRNEHFSGLLSMLYVEDVPLAAHFGLRYGRTLSYWFQAYSTEFNVYSPGLLQTMQTIEGAAANGVELVDLGKGHKRYKEELKSYDLTVAEGIVTRRTPLGAVQWARSTPTAWAIREIRTHESAFNAFDRALKKGAALRGSLRPRSGRSSRLPAWPPGCLPICDLDPVIRRTRWHVTSVTDRHMSVYNSMWLISSVRLVVSSGWLSSTLA